MRCQVWAGLRICRIASQISQNLTCYLTNLNPILIIPIFVGRFVYRRYLRLTVQTS